MESDGPIKPSRRPIAARPLNTLAAGLERTSRRQGPVSVEGGGNPLWRDGEAEHFVARLIGNANPYDLVEVYGTAGGGHADLTGGITCTACFYEDNNTLNLNGLVVRGVHAVPNVPGEFRGSFQYDPGTPAGCPHVACFTVRHLDGGTPYSTIGFTITGPGGFSLTDTTDTDGKYCFTYTPGSGSGYGITFPDPTALTDCNSTINLIPPHATACFIENCFEVCYGRMEVKVTGPGHDGLTVGPEVILAVNCGIACGATDNTSIGPHGITFIGETTDAGSPGDPDADPPVPPVPPSSTYSWDFCQLVACPGVPCHLPYHVWFTAGPTNADDAPSFPNCTDGEDEFTCGETTTGSIQLISTDGYVNDHCLTCDVGCCVTPGPDYRGWTRKKLHLTITQVFPAATVDLTLDGLLGTALEVNWVDKSPIPGGTTAVDHWQSDCLDVIGDLYFCISDPTHEHQKYQSARVDLWSCSPDWPSPNKNNFSITYTRFTGTTCTGIPFCPFGLSDVAFLAGSFFRGFGDPAIGYYGRPNTICTGRAASFDGFGSSPFGISGFISN